MEHLVLHCFLALGIIAISFYSFMSYIKRSPKYPHPSKLVVYGLVLLAIIGALIPLSQFGNEKLGLFHYFKILYVAAALPGFAVGFAVFRVLILRGPNYFAKK